MSPKLKGAPSQKAAIFKLVAVKSSKLIFTLLLKNTNRKQSMDIATSLMANCIHANASSDHSDKLNYFSYTLPEMDVPYYVCTDVPSSHSSD
jgi:hypothetical protein